MSLYQSSNGLSPIDKMITSLYSHPLTVRKWRLLLTRNLWRKFTYGQAITVMSLEDSTRSTVYHCLVSILNCLELYHYFFFVFYKEKKITLAYCVTKFTMLCLKVRNISIFYIKSAQGSVHKIFICKTHMNSTYCQTVSMINILWIPVFLCLLSFYIITNYFLIWHHFADRLEIIQYFNKFILHILPSFKKIILNHEITH